LAFDLSTAAAFTISSICMIALSSLGFFGV
jgi:hypothetical protein